MSATRVKGDRRGSAAVFCAAAAGLLVIGIGIAQFSGQSPAPVAHTDLQLPAAPFLSPPAFPVPVQVSPSGSATVQPSRDRTAEARRRPPATVAPARTTVRTGATPRGTATAARTTTRPVAPALRAGASVGLELADVPGHRVRHRDFRGRTDPVGPRSSALTRADSRFLVRPGLDGEGCFSFEAGNQPGRFLRHRDFEVRLDRRDGSRLFDRDATFCPVTRGRAGAVALRSRNYPDRFVTAAGPLLRLTPATTGTATRFVVRPPL